MAPPTVDYSLYLVTDPHLSPPDTTLEEQVEKAIAGGVTLVQLREKDAETKDFIERAKRIHAMTRAAGIPLLINDRLDVALAIDAEGVHIGQDDIDVATARKLLGPDKIIGLSVSFVSEAAQAVEAGVDYIGVGAVYDTATKNPKNPPIGISGLRKILSYLSSVPKYMPAVAIGSCNLHTTRNIMYLSAVPGRSLDGVAVVSAIIGAEDPKEASSKLLALVKEPPYWMSVINNRSAESIVQAVPAVIKKVFITTPLVHNIINRVAINFAANVDLAIGASPIMTENEPEFNDIASIPNAGLLLNMNMATEEKVNLFISAIRAYNGLSKTTVFDPIGAGASTLRQTAVKTLLNSVHFDVIKGNEGEIFSVAGEASSMRGVDSTANSALDKKVHVVEGLASKEKSIVVLTGEQDIVSDGISTFILSNGHEYLASITASGCVLGSIITAMSIVSIEDRLLASIAAILLYTIAAERAAQQPSVRGPGSFIPALIDELYLLVKATAVENDTEWLNDARLTQYIVPT
ncbi:Hydroxyethylthiazole kinase family-domain-containing protein [Lipomyces oligophaga]|uniref:Hydroxyethylthiazole kinase family-domain-containing protein n=1 Tax=Lipomyces oligophaga TaxID=45792 RepID=UPI0034CDD22B